MNTYGQHSSYDCKTPQHTNFEKSLQPVHCLHAKHETEDGADNSAVCTTHAGTFVYNQYSKHNTAGITHTFCMYIPETCKIRVRIPDAYLLDGG